MEKRCGSFLLVAMLVFAGCEAEQPPDPRQAQLVGTWRDGRTGSFTLKSDGSYTAEVIQLIQLLPDSPKSFQLKGTWKTVPGAIVFHIDESTYANERFADRDVTEKFIYIAEDSFQTVNQDGHQVQYDRIKEPQAASE